jgi:hypothetical protein
MGMGNNTEIFQNYIKFYFLKCLCNLPTVTNMLAQLTNMLAQLAKHAQWARPMGQTSQKHWQNMPNMLFETCQTCWANMTFGWILKNILNSPKHVCQTCINFTIFPSALWQFGHVKSLWDAFQR